jgi:hypothetical protein
MAGTESVAGRCLALRQSRRWWPGAPPRAAEQSLRPHQHRADLGRRPARGRLGGVRRCPAVASQQGPSTEAAVAWVAKAVAAERRKNLE